MLREMAGEIIVERTSPMEGREDTPIEYVPYRRFEEHIREEEKHWLWMRKMVFASFVLTVVAILMLGILLAYFPEPR